MLPPSGAKAACADQGLVLFPAATSKYELSIAALYVPMYYDIKHDGTNFIRPFDNSVVGDDVIMNDAHKMFHNDEVSISDCGHNKDSNVRLTVCSEVDESLNVVCVEP